MKYGLIGSPLSQSFSPELHALLGDPDYTLCEISDPAAFLKARDFCGVNVTIPYKQAVLSCLDELSPDARETGAVNTILNRGGTLYGDNTDLGGLLDLIAHTGIEVAGKHVLILGTGGTAHTAAVACKRLAAKKISFASRTNPACLTYDQAERSDAEVVINATPRGMFPFENDAPFALPASVTGVLDAVYHPLRTDLVLSAQTRGIKAAGGMYMLVSQAARSFALFHGISYDPAQTETVYRAFLSRKENTVLIGLPGCGKTTYGKRLAAETHRPFVDTDSLLGDIPALFASVGEEGFREKETEVVRALSRETGLVIATGGGTVLRDENVRLLKRNGRLLFLDRPVDELLPTPDRPLADTKEKLFALAKTRLPRYLEVCDETLKKEDFQ